MYMQSCAACHDGGVERAPQRQVLKTMSPDRVLAAMESGEMVYMASRWPAAGRRAIAEFITGKPLNAAASAPSEATCATSSAAFRESGPAWNGWGANTSNTRFQESAAAGLTAADVPRLKLKWAFGFPGDILTTANGAPTIAGGLIFVGAPNARVYALDAASGCIRWSVETGARVRTAITVARIQTASGAVTVAFFGDGRANAWAVEAGSGRQMWKVKVDDFPGAGITGSPVYYAGRVYVPVRGNDEVFAIDPKYECCRFRGSLAALDAATGKQIWKTYTIDEPARPTGKNIIGTQLWGPSGAPVWTTPAIDPKRNAIYVTTGDNYSRPATKTSDAFMALDLATGKVLWTRQMTTGDAWTSACRLPDKTNCPDTDAPDFDFASSPILVNLPNGRRVLLAGQKSGVVHALDPGRQGKILWQVRVGKGGTFGGVQWGSAADQSNVYVALSDLGRITIPNSQGTVPDPQVGGGMFALRLDNGQRVWHTPPPPCGTRERCSPAQSAAVSAIPGAVFSGSVDGHLRAFSTVDGTIVWDFDTVRSYETVNRVPARGGSLNVGGPAIAGGMVFVNSGYIQNGIPGNVLLAFSVDGK